MKEGNTDKCCAPAALTVSGRPGNIGQVSRRLRPMAEHLLAENGENVLDVLLQLLEVSSIAIHLSGILLAEFGLRVS